MVTKKTSIWDGPCSDTLNGGITQGLISKFLMCRERFRLYVVKGIKTEDSFNHRMEYGNLWHICEEAFSKNIPTALQNSEGWLAKLTSYSRELCKRYPTQQDLIYHWMNVCKTQFPFYVDYWKKNKDMVLRTPLLQEEVFSVRYTLPSNRVVTLRGKWDGVDLIGKGKSASIYLFETKTKGDINEQQLLRQLSSGYDLQTMFYLIALKEAVKDPLRKGPSRYEVFMGNENKNIAGVRYNVIRRPLSGGKGTIVQHKPTKSNPHGESKEHFYARLGEYIKEEPQHYFMRWTVEVHSTDIENFKKKCLNPILECMCDWWDHIYHNETQASPGTKDIELWGGSHWITPYGMYNSLAEGGESEIDQYVVNGSDIGLTNTTNLFPELQS